MPSESFSAAAGTFATLDAQARADEAEAMGEKPPCRLGKVVQLPDLFGVCDCGVRLDASNEAQLRHLFGEHIRQVEGKPAGRRGLAKARAALADVAVRRDEGRWS